jgi:hypothetical protein
MGQSIALISSLLVALATLAFFFGAVGALLSWIDATTSNYVVMGSLIAIGAFTTIVAATLPFYERD